MSLVSNDTISMIIKFNKREICQQKITISLINERHVLLGRYFYTHVSHLLCFDMNDVVSFNTKYLFLPVMHQCLHIRNICIFSTHKSGYEITCV